MRRAIGAIIAIQPTIIASGTRASSTHHEVRAAIVTITAATSITPTNGIPLLKHIIGFSFFRRLIDETTEEAQGIQRRGVESQRPERRRATLGGAAANPWARRRTCRARRTRTRTRSPARPAAVCAPGGGEPSQRRASRREAWRSAGTLGRER